MKEPKPNKKYAKMCDPLMMLIARAQAPQCLKVSRSGARIQTSTPSNPLLRGGFCTYVYVHSILGFPAFCGVRGHLSFVIRGHRQLAVTVNLNFPTSPRLQISLLMIRISFSRTRHDGTSTRNIHVTHYCNAELSCLYHNIVDEDTV